MHTTSVRDRFMRALDGLVEQVKQDRSILAAILCGSLSHDTVWERSDIDLVLVTIDDRNVPGGERSLYAEGTNVHAHLLPRANFRKIVEGSLRNSFMHSLLAKGRVLFTHDETIAALHESLRAIGRRDSRVQLLGAATEAVASLNKAHKWFITREDLDYAALWILYAAVPLAQIEVMSRQILADREVLPQALALNPSFFDLVYTQMLNTKKTKSSVRAALDAADAYIAEREAELFSLVLEHLREVAEPRSCTELEDHFARNLGLRGVTAACEYLADVGRIGKGSTTLRLTKKSNVGVQELAFFYIKEAPNGPEASDRLETDI